MKLQWKMVQGKHSGDVAGFVVRHAIFGECSRYRVEEFRTRDFGQGRETRWLVFDAERYDYDNDCRASMIRDCATLNEALKGLPQADL